MGKLDIVLLTDPRYVNPEPVEWYIRNILDEERLVTRALESRGLKVWRTNWDNPDFDWSRTRYIMFRTTWDYFDRYPEFSSWMQEVRSLTKMINPYSIIQWNLDKHYLQDLMDKGINIPPTVFVEKGDKRSLAEIVHTTGWASVILKPVVSGAARHTYRLNPVNISQHEQVYRELIAHESMMLQEFQDKVINRGEVAHMLFGGIYSHSVLKKAKEGDFRVQDDFGGSVSRYEAEEYEIGFAQKVMACCNPVPVYGRVDVIWDNNDELCVSELELIEPELWFRMYPEAAELMADAVLNAIG